MSDANITRLLQQPDNNLTYGYCHGCDRQVPINLNSFTCVVCNNGFVELLDEASTTTGQTPQTNQPQQQQQQQQNRIRPNPNETLPHFIFRSIQQPAVAGQRVELVLPAGEQYDFYGMLNNLIAGLLGPHGPVGAATGGGQRQGPIHMFQIHGDLRDYAWGATGLDAIITQLLNQLETSGPAPATDAQINGLQDEVITNDHLEKSDQCAICMEEYKINDKAKKLPCKHYFHFDCISQWLKLHGTCPVCRKTLSGEDTSQREYVRPATNNENRSPGAQHSASNNSLNLNQSNNSSNQSNRNRPNSNNNDNNNTRNNVYYDEMDFD